MPTITIEPFGLQVEVWWKGLPLPKRLKAIHAEREGSSIAVFAPTNKHPAVLFFQSPPHKDPRTTIHEAVHIALWVLDSIGADTINLYGPLGNQTEPQASYLLTGGCTEEVLAYLTEYTYHLLTQTSKHYKPPPPKPERDTATPEKISKTSERG